jgi:hypothetical protein
MFALRLPVLAAVALPPNCYQVFEWAASAAVRQQLKKAKKYPANRCSQLANDVKHGLSTLVQYRSVAAGRRENCVVVGSPTPLHLVMSVKVRLIVVPDRHACNTFRTPWGRKYLRFFSVRGLDIFQCGNDADQPVSVH